MIAVRAVHFAATLLYSGTVLFAACIVGPASRGALAASALNAWRRQLTRLAWSSLAIAVGSGAAWLLLLAAEIGGRPLSNVLSGDIAWRVLTSTRFGLDWSARFIMALLLAAGMVARARSRDVVPRALNAILVVLALSFLGSLAWSGHASGTPGAVGEVHIVADVAHLIAAGIWVGSLLPLVLLFAAARRTTDPAVASFARETTLRFSAFGVIAVGTVLATGLVNACVMVGSLPALVSTDYGRLLMLKMGLFATMVFIAAFNRLHLTPRLLSTRNAADAQRLLQRNSLIEAALALTILIIVGALGTLPPAVHALPASHMHGQ
jgi:copper resistance protein D